ncbi:FAD-dependent oxidoreductase [Blastococcus brunescens]|uniref:FAD-dependent monooxygenase n=1 Tax=Blastococcus brunescens TaxID=1564165 RepID=A0ABZ1B4I4_9ACTN|nr:FAD-dependent monooxygenase [Blastococcus sp. BMG 8361]WRL65709.1 FAD-dependent monooxygenase [Blastococcus sp. BMG 8361]
MTGDRVRSQVAIVGGGPVGMGLAIGLGQLGIQCAVIERREQPQPVPKGQNLTQRTMEHMRAWGPRSASVRVGRSRPSSASWGTRPTARSSDRTPTSGSAAPPSAASTRPTTSASRSTPPSGRSASAWRRCQTSRSTTAGGPSR